MSARIRSTFRFIWSVYGAFIFVVEAIIYTPLFFLFTVFGSKNIREKFLKLSYYYVPRFHFIPCFIRMNIKGKEKLDKNGQYIIVSNHQSMLDIYANPYACPVFFKYLSKSEVKDIPVLGKIAGAYCVFVNRKDSESRKQSYLNMKKAIADGYSILIYPEGTRNRTDQPLKSFHDGAFKLAIDTGTPIAVQTLVNSAALASPFKLFDLAPGTIQCYWDDPIETVNYSQADLPALKERVISIMLDHLITKEDPTTTIN